MERAPELRIRLECRACGDVIDAAAPDGIPTCPCCNDPKAPLEWNCAKCDSLNSGFRSDLLYIR